MTINQIEENISEYLKAYNQEWNFGGTIGIIDNDISIIRNYGFSNIENKKPNNSDTKYYLFSCSKQFTAMGIMILHDRGLLDIHDKIYLYLPEFEQEHSEITLHHLLTHTSGLFNYISLPDFWSNIVKVNNSDETITKYILDGNISFKPGKGYEYCTSGYYLLNRIIKIVTNNSFEDYITENIFKPLGMMNSGFIINKTKAANMAKGYEWKAEKLYPEKFFENSNFNGSGGIYSTVNDLIKWHNALNNESFCNEKMKKQIFNPYDNKYGYGWGVWKNNEELIANHIGAQPGTGGTSLIRRYINKNRAFFLLSNYGIPDVSKIVDNLEKIIDDETVSLPQKAKKVKLEPKVLDEVTGIYNGFMKIEVKANKQSGKIEIELKDLAVFFAEYIGDYCFQDTKKDSILKFEKDKNGDISLWGIKKQTA